jgi:hypothetical protein
MDVDNEPANAVVVGSTSTGLITEMDDVPFFAVWRRIIAAVWF